MLHSILRNGLRGVTLKERRPIPMRKTILDIEKNSLTSNLDNVSPFGSLESDFVEREIILLRYPVRKPLKL